MQQHARLANLHPPTLHSHDRFGNRIDEVEFHPSYHALLGAALQHRLHGAPWAADGPSHVERAAGFMLFTELEPSVLCPVSMTYAVAPALRANAALQHTFAGLLASPRYDAALPARQRQDGDDDGHGHDGEAGRLRRARQHHAAPCPTAATPGASAIGWWATSGSCRRR